MAGKKRARPAEGEGGERRGAELPPHEFVLAPMVGGSELAFRLLCRRYASPDLLCYTPMMDSARFATQPSYREQIFQTTPADRPLVAHFSGNEPQTLLSAARLVESSVDAVDLNLGCPQRIAHSGHFGSFLLDDKDRPLVLQIVSTLSTSLSIPVFCKIRLLETTQQTIRLCESLRDAGASLIAIHARHRVNLVGRTGAGARDGAALLEEVAAVKSSVGGVRIIANGNVRCWEDVVSNRESTGADGIMSAEGLLDDPTLFLPTRKALPAIRAKQQPDASEVGEAAKEVKRLEKKLRQIKALEAREGVPLNSEEEAKVKQKKSIRKALKKYRAASEEASTEQQPPAPAPQPSAPTPPQLGLEYLELAEKTGVNIKCAVFHVRRMAKHALLKYQLMDEVLSSTSIKSLRVLLEQCVHYDASGSFVFDPDKERRQKEALQLKKWREATRKRYEERMVRKAVRENRPKDYYLNQGAKLPTPEEMAVLRGMSPEARWEQWKQHHSQHCYALHFEEGGCSRAKTCAFLHADIAEPASANDPSWLQEKNGM